MSVKHKCEDLPEGWVVKMSRSRGVQYYFDTHTGQSSWKKPTVRSSIKVPNETAKKKFHSEESSADQLSKEKNSSFLNKMRGEIKKHRETYSKMSQIRKKAQDVQRKEMERAIKKVAEWKKSIQNSCGKAPAEAKLIANNRNDGMNNADVIKTSQKKEGKSKSGEEKKPVPKNITYERTEVKKEFAAEKIVPERININRETGKSGRKRKKKKKGETTISEKVHTIANKEKMKASTQPAKKSQTIATLNKLNTQAVQERLKSSLPCLDVKHNQLKNIINKKLTKRQPSEAVVSCTISNSTEGTKPIIRPHTTCNMAKSNSANSGKMRIPREVEVDNAEDDCMMEGIEVTDPRDVYQIIDDIHMEFQEKLRPVYVVLDTNVLIYDWKFLKQKTNADSTECAYVCFIVPWVVIQELDSLKQAKRSPSLTTNVTNAIKYVNQAIREKHRMIGQSVQDTTLIQEFDIKNNDDKILQCCLQYQQRIKNGRLALCTNDINLQTKAMVSGINAFSQKDFMKEIEKLQGSGSVLPGDMQIEPVHCYNKSAPISTDPGTANNSQVLSLPEIEAEMFAVLKGTLSVALETEMKDVYDKHWKDIVIVKPPWSFKDIMVCYNKHWIAVFGMFLPRNFKTVVESLLSYAKKANTPKVESPEKLKLIISQAIGLCQSHVPHFKERIPELQRAIKLLFSLHNQCNNLLNTLTHTTEDTREKAENDIAEENLVNRVTSSVSKDQSSIHIAQVFETVWQVITQISVLVFDSVGFTHTIECKGIEHMARPNIQQAVQWLYSSGQMLQDIVKAFHRVLETSTPSLQDASTLQEALNHLLVESKATLDVVVDAQDFQVFCSQENNRKVLAGGLVQFKDILTMLEQCAVSCSNIST